MVTTKITVITSVLNGADTLQRCIDSVACQSWPYREHIVIDGGSTDGSVSIILESDSRLAYWTSESDNGIYDAWNKGLQIASGDWVVFLGADDYFYDENVLSSVVDFIAQNTDAALIYGKTEQVDTEGKVVRELGLPWEVAKNTIDTYMSIPHPSCFYHNTLFSSFGGFDETFKISGDYDFLLRVIRHAHPAFLDIVISRMGIGGVSDNPLSLYRSLIEDKRAQRRNGVSNISLTYYYRVAKHYLRSLLSRNCNSN